MSLKKEIVYRVGIQKKYGFDQNGKLLALDRFIEQEIEILKPQAIIFLTGPSYDKFLPSKPSNIEKYTNEFKPRQIGKLECCGVPALRTYHPKYLRLSGNEKRYKELILSFIKNPK